MSETGEAGRIARLVTDRRAKWAIVIFWLALTVACVGPAAGLTGQQSNDAAAWLPPDAESTEVLEKASVFSSPDEAPAVVVYERESGITQADLDAVAAQAARFDDLEGVDREIPPPMPSEDGQGLQLFVMINGGEAGWETFGEVVKEIRAERDALPDGLEMYVTGPGGYAADSITAFEGIDGVLLFAAAAVVIITLLFTYRSPVLWLLPVLSAGVALFVSQAVIYFLARYADLTVNAQSASILTVLVFGAGTDYALLLVARYREELRRHEDRHEAMALALHRAGPAILASGATVVVGLLCLLLATMSSTSGLGPVAAIGILVALAAMLTLLPAMLVCVGRWIFWPARPSYGSEDHTADGVWAKVGRRIAVRPRPVWIGTTLVLGALAVGTLGLDAHGLTNKDSFTSTPESVVGEEVLVAHFDAGTGNPVVVVAAPDQVDEVRSAFRGVEGIDADSVTQPVVKGGIAYLEGTMTEAPDTDAGRDVVKRVRAAIHDVDGGDALAGGGTALVLDTIEASTRDNVVIIPIVLLVVLLILIGLLRALIAPVILLATVVLSYGAALGISTLVFERVFGFSGADASFPLFVFVFLVALGIDYNIFLMTRVHEESKRVGTRRGALIGLQATGGVITSAGLVLAGTFAVLGTLPLVFAAELGIAVALGVLLDTIIVRSVLVTALNLDLGRWMWWPSPLFRTDGGGRGDEPDADARPVVLEKV